MPKYLVILLLLSNSRECFGAVLRGARAQDGQFPWLVQFHTIAPCGGVLISPDWVLTAAQCVEYKRNSIELYATGLNGTGSSQTVSVKATYIFPQYRGYSKIRDYDNNIALLKLVRSFDMCDAKIRLLDTAPVRFDDDYKSCLIFGWQSTVAPSSKVHAKPVQYSKVLLNSWRVCMYLHEGNASYKNVFCAMVEDENGIRACAGNPGSPVVCEDQSRRMVLVGIASWSNFSLDCGGLPTYLGVSVFRTWMRDLIFGNKNIEQWEAGGETRNVGCRRKDADGEGHRRRKIGNYTETGIYSGINSSPRDYEGEDEEFYDSSWRVSERRTNGVAKFSDRGKSEISGVEELTSELEPPMFDRGDDYGTVLGPDGPRRPADFDVVRERDERLSQYREIGGRRDDGFDEPEAKPSEQEKRTIFVGKFGRKAVQPDKEIFDDFELIMPDGIESFERSAAATRTFTSGFVDIFFVCFCNIFYAIVR